MEKNNARPTKGQSSANEHPQDSQNHEPEQFELLPLPPFNPGWPKVGTLADEVLARLLTGERLTQPSFGTDRWRLAAYVQVLKDLGWPVCSAPIPEDFKLVVASTDKIYAAFFSW